MDAIKTPWERLVDAVGTLWGSGVHAISGKLDSKIDVFRVDPTVCWQVFRMLYKRCGIAVWCDRGLSKEASDIIFYNVLVWRGQEPNPRPPACRAYTLPLSHRCAAVYAYISTLSTLTPHSWVAWSRVVWNRNTTMNILYKEIIMMFNVPVCIAYVRGIHF